MANDEYLKLFNARVTVLETLGGQLPVHETLVISKPKVMGVSSEDIENPEEKTDEATYVKCSKLLRRST